MDSRRQGKGQSSVPTKWIVRDVTPAALVASRKALRLPDDNAELVRLEVDPDSFYTAESFRRAYWRAEMWSKFPLDIGIDREQAARAAFTAAEEQCAATNARLVDVFNRTSVPERYRKILLKARSLLHDLLGHIDRSVVVTHARWGPGSSQTLPRRYSTPSNKWLWSHTVTQGCLPYLDAFAAWTGWEFLTPELVPGNTVTFVDKNAKTKRSIAIEPDWNAFFQAGLGRAMSTALQRKGLLSPIAQEIHQRLAQKGSADGFLATVDLKAASDTVALGLVEALLPERVVEIILELRSPYGSLDRGATWFPYEKTSSMGCGFTFELETSLLWAISKAVAGHASVFGDDIVVPSAAVSELQDILGFCGMTFNLKKSFSGPSPFRESCGGHYFKGVDVTPIYVRKRLSGVERIAFANNLLRAIEMHVMPELLPVWDAAVQGVPRVFHGPRTVDGCLHQQVGHGSPQWSGKYQTFRGLRLVKQYRTKDPLQVGAYRSVLYSGRYAPEGGWETRLFGPRTSRFKWEKEPGVPTTVVSVWYSDVGPSWRRGLPLIRPLVPAWRKS